MHTSHFQIAIIAALSGCVGFLLSSPVAIGYPGGAAVSLGSEPTFSVGGTESGSTLTVLTSPADQKAVVTDVVLTTSADNCYASVQMDTAGSTVGMFKLHADWANNNGWGNPTRSPPTQVAHSFSSGLPIEPGDSLSLSASGGCSVAYTISGYYAQP